MSKEYSIEITEAIKNYLEEEELSYNFDDEDGVFSLRVRMSGNIREIRCYIVVNALDYFVWTTSSLCANETDQNQMQKIAEFLGRANMNLKFGNFELDYNNGTIRYKTYTDCEGIIVPNEIIDRSIKFGPAMFDAYGKGIGKILFGDVSVKEAIELCDKELMD